MARRAAYLDDVWNEGRAMLMLDGGNLFGRRTAVDREQTRFLCEVTGEFGYDAIAFGEREMNYGLPFLREMIETYDLPFTSANVFDERTGETILPRYLLVERGGVSFGIISVIDPGYRLMSMEAQDEPLRVDDPVATLRELIPEVRRAGAETIILLSHMGDPGTESLLRQVRGVDLCLVGHTHRYYNAPRIFEKVVLLAGSFEGRVIGRLDGSFGPGGGAPAALELEIVSLGEEIGDDPVMLQRVEQAKARLDEVRLAQRGRFQPTKGSAEEQFLSERECRKCHTDVWQKLRESPHQNAMGSLVAKGQGSNPECLVCHTTGYLYRNGYDDRPPYNRLGNVQCEACHGYGSEHDRDGDWARAARESCTECHDQKNSPEFDFATYWERIRH